MMAMTANVAESHERNRSELAVGQTRCRTITNRISEPGVIDSFARTSSLVEVITHRGAITGTNVVRHQLGMKADSVTGYPVRPGKGNHAGLLQFSTTGLRNHRSRNWLKWHPGVTVEGSLVAVNGKLCPIHLIFQVDLDAVSLIGPKDERFEGFGTGFHCCNIGSRDISQSVRVSLFVPVVRDGQVDCRHIKSFDGTASYTSAVHRCFRQCALIRGVSGS